MELDGRLGRLHDAAHAVAAELDRADAVGRLLRRDHTLWQDEPTEVADRLGWLDLPRSMDAREVDAACAPLRARRDVVVMGMGGSSLFPEVIARTHDAVAGHPRLHVLDSTHPAAVRRLGELGADTLFVVASKSGTTVETRSHLDHAWASTGGTGERFVAITDPGTELAELGRERGFARVFENPTDVGGRYSALSYFGLVPAALAGADVAALLAGGRSALEELEAAGGVADDTGAWLGAVVAAAARAGRDKLTLVLPPAVAAFGDWVEQLVAESSGKAGTGVVPVVGEPLAGPGAYGADRLFVAYGGSDRLDELAAAGHPVAVLPEVAPDGLGREVVRWEVATALACAALGVNAFDQPDVAAAKDATARALAGGTPVVEATAVEDLLATVQPGDYIAILAYVDPGAPVVEALDQARVALRDRLRVAVTLGIGPRYLHSTGQLHKGGARNGVFLQVVETGDEDVAIPGRDLTFRELLLAQAAGDLEALRARGRRAGRVALDELLAVRG